MISHDMVLIIQCMIGMMFDKGKFVSVLNYISTMTYIFMGNGYKQTDIFLYTFTTLILMAECVNVYMTHFYKSVAVGSKVEKFE
jgi:hypothetical protein